MPNGIWMSLMSRWDAFHSFRRFSLIFADFWRCSLSLGNAAFRRRRNHRKPQIFEENRRKPQIFAETRLSIEFVPFNSALFSAPFGATRQLFPIYLCNDFDSHSTVEWVPSFSLQKCLVIMYPQLPAVLRTPSLRERKGDYSLKWYNAI